MKLQQSIERIRHIAETLPEDDPDKMEMLDIEGDYTALMEWALRRHNEYSVQAEACADLSDIYRHREKSFESRAANMKNIVQWIMDEANESKFQGISATVSVRAVPPKPIVTDEALVPERFKKISVSIDKAAINEAVEAGEVIPGVSLGNGNQSLTIRRK